MISLQCFVLPVFSKTGLDIWRTVQQNSLLIPIPSEGGWPTSVSSCWRLHQWKCSKWKWGRTNLQTWFHQFGSLCAAGQVISAGLRRRWYQTTQFFRRCGIPMETRGHGSQDGTAARDLWTACPAQPPRVQHARASFNSICFPMLKGHKRRKFSRSWCRQFSSPHCSPEFC